MNPLSLFPSLLYFGLLAPTILRIGAAVVLGRAGLARYGKPFRYTSILYVLCSVFLMLGLYTQPAAIIGIALVVFDIYANKKTASLNPAENPTEKSSYFLLVLILISLLFTGPGFLAFDLPL